MRAAKAGLVSKAAPSLSEVHVGSSRKWAPCTVLVLNHHSPDPVPRLTPHYRQCVCLSVPEASHGDAQVEYHNCYEPSSTELGIQGCSCPGAASGEFSGMEEGVVAGAPLKGSLPPSTEVFNRLQNRLPQTGAKLVTCWENGQQGQSMSLTTAAGLVPQSSGHEAQGSGSNSPVS